MQGINLDVVPLKNCIETLFFVVFLAFYIFVRTMLTSSGVCLEQISAGSVFVAYGS